MSDVINYYLKDFDGPLDLLLHLIKVNEMDIFDIPIVEITAQYLDFLHEAESRNLDIAGEFLVMAATLMAIKSTYLLPRPEVTMDDDLAQVIEDADLDPRQMLMTQLLEYQRYQQAAADLREREDARLLQFGRAPMLAPATIEVVPLPAGLQLDDLQKAFSHMLTKRIKKTVRTRTMQGESWLIGERMTAIMAKIPLTTAILFEDIFDDSTDRELLVTTFLALLELVRHQQVAIKQTIEFGAIAITRGPVPFNEIEKEIKDDELATD